MNRDLVRQVWLRAEGCCEYCKLLARFHPSPFQVDHIIARQHGGVSELSNLALSCLHCNVRKGPNIAGVDPLSPDPVRLYHPRNDVWAEHFQWNGAELTGRTAVGRVTINVLGINAPDFLEVRSELMREGCLLYTSPSPRD